jgi:hypothetical protein
LEIPPAPTVAGGMVHLVWVLKGKRRKAAVGFQAMARFLLPPIFFLFFVRPCAPFCCERSERAEPQISKNATYVVFSAKNNQLIAKKVTFKKILTIK